MSDKNNVYVRMGFVTSISFGGFMNYLLEQNEIDTVQIRRITYLLRANFLSENLAEYFDGTDSSVPLYNIDDIDVVVEYLGYYVRDELFKNYKDENVKIIHPDFETLTCFFPECKNLDIMVDVQFKNKEALNLYKLKNPKLYHNYKDNMYKG